MARATSRKSLRTASEVKRGADAASDGGGGGAGRPAGLPSSGTPRTGGGVRENAELRLGNVEMEPVELLVQRADLMTVFRCEQGEVGIEAPGFGGALGERRLPLGDTRPQCTEIVRRWSGWYERGHLRIIAGVRRPSLQGTMFVAKPEAERAGFKFWKPLVWDKRTIGMGYHYRARCEFILFFEKGKRRLNDLGVADVLSCTASAWRLPS